MTPEEQKQFNDLFDLFNHPGWKTFQADIKTLHDTLRVGAVDGSADAFLETKGRVYGLAFSLNYEVITYNNYDNRQDQSND